jgi:cholera toxin transcriptional activator
MTLAEVDGVKVQTQMNHPDLSDWLPAIKKCVAHYNNNHTGMLKPTEVIATGKQNNSLILNYIHRQEYSNKNMTLRIYASQSADLSNICKGAQ